MSDRLLVTGCAGFIASRVCTRLLDGGKAVLGVDNVNDAYDPRLKRWRLARLQDRAGFELLEADIANRDTLDRLLARGEKFSAVVNLAARAGVRASVANPWVYIDANITGTLNLLELCRKLGTPKFMLASTSSLYGAHNPLPYREDADVTRPLSPYAASKLAAEAMAYSHHHLHGLDVSVCRFFTVYGPAGRPDMSVFRFVRQIAEGAPIVVYGDGNQERDFTYVDDIARGTIAALEPCGYEVFNLGSDRPARLNEVIEKIARLTGQTPRIERRPAHKADVPATWADITKARTRLGWQPEVGLEAGLEQCVAWYLQNRDEMFRIDLGD